jgi:hypothetical protein
MPHRTTGLVERRSVSTLAISYITDLSSAEYLQERLSRETSKPEFSEMPFRFAEIAKVLLDV